jgi:hypothetical protein
MARISVSFSGVPRTVTPATILRLGLLVGPVAYLVMVGYVVLARVGYPFELEWMEGGSLQHLLRLQSGLPIYVPPSLEFTPYLYPPFYYYLALLLAKLPGLGWFLPLRLTSVLASLGCLVCIVGIIRKHTASLYWGWVAAGLFLATFRLGGAWFDLARVDMLFVFLLLAAQWALLSGHRGEIWAGALLALAFYTKQTAVAVLLPLVPAVIWRRGWRAGLRLVLPFLAIAGGTTAVEHWRSDGWYSYYVFHLPRQHGLAKPFFEQLALRLGKLFEPLTVATVLGLAHAVVGRRLAWKDDAGLTGIFILGLVGLGLVAGMNFGCYDNANIPAFAGLSLSLGLAGHWLEGKLASDVGRIAVSIACAAQFGILFFDVKAQLPTEADRQAGQAIVQQLRSAPGDVLIPSHNYLAQPAGKTMYAHEIALLEVQGAYTAGAFHVDAELESALRRDLAQTRFSLIVLDGEHPMWQPVFEAYQSAPLVYPHPNDFLPVTGMRTRPRTLWTPP